MATMQINMSKVFKNHKMKQNSHKIFKLIVLLGVFPITLICTSYKIKEVDKISKIVISRNYPNIQPNGKIKYSDNNLSIYYCNEYEIYEYPSNQSFFTFNSNGETTNDSNRIVIEYFICKKNQNYGVIYSKGKGSSLSSYKKVVAKVDSIVYRVLVSSLDLDLTNLKLIESKSDLGIVEEKYVPKIKLSNPVSLIDTISFFFTKNMMDVDYTFSKKTDSLKGTKFIGYKARFLSKFYGNYPVKIDEIQLNLEMKKAPVDNVEFILSLVKQFKKDKQHILN